MKIAIIGAGLGGLTFGALAARDGHQVEVLPSPLPINTPPQITPISHHQHPSLPTLPTYHYHPLPPQHQCLHNC